MEVEIRVLFGSKSVANQSIVHVRYSARHGRRSTGAALPCPSPQLELEFPLFINKILFTVLFFRLSAWDTTDRQYILSGQTCFTVVALIIRSFNDRLGLVRDSE